MEEVGEFISNEKEMSQGNGKRFGKSRNLTGDSMLTGNQTSAVKPWEKIQDTLEKSVRKKNSRRRKKIFVCLCVQRSTIRILRPYSLRMCTIANKYEQRRKKKEN